MHMSDLKRSANSLNKKNFLNLINGMEFYKKKKCNVGDNESKTKTKRKNSDSGWCSDKNIE